MVNGEKSSFGDQGYSQEFGNGSSGLFDHDSGDDDDNEDIGKEVKGQTAMEYDDSDEDGQG